MQTQRIQRVTKIGKSRSLDLEVENENHNFYANGVIVSNSHSTAYSALCAITAYLKQHHPLHFFLHCLNIAKDESESMERIARIYSEMKIWGIKMLPPDLGIANDNFVIENGGIRYGLSAIKGISNAKLAKLRLFKPDISNKFALFQSAKDAGLDITVLSALIYAGALGLKIEESRCCVVMEAQLWGLLKPAEKQFCLEVGPQFNHDLLAIMRHMAELAEQDGKKRKISRIATIRKGFSPIQRMYLQNSKYEDLTNWHYERRLLGFAYTKTLKQIFEQRAGEFGDTLEISALDDNTQTSFVGIVEFAKHGKTKKGKPFSRFVISDELGQIGAFLFDPTREYLIREEGKVLPKEDGIYTFKIKKGRDMNHIVDYSEQKNLIFFTKADINDKNDQI